MAELLLKYYKHVSDLKGHSGKLQLAQMTKISPVMAATEPDTPETINSFKKAIEQITGTAPPNL